MLQRVRQVVLLLQWKLWSNGLYYPAEICNCQLEYKPDLDMSTKLVVKLDQGMTAVSNIWADMESVALIRNHLRPPLEVAWDTNTWQTHQAHGSGRTGVDEGLKHGAEWGKEYIRDSSCSSTRKRGKG